jgi:hypothetical protein
MTRYRTSEAVGTDQPYSALPYDELFPNDQLPFVPITSEPMFSSNNIPVHYNDQIPVSDNSEKPLYFNHKVQQWLHNTYISHFCDLATEHDTEHDTEYNCVEQFVQAAKAMFYHDESIFYDIIHEKDPFQLAHLSDFIEIHKLGTYPYAWKESHSMFALRITNSPLPTSKTRV